MALAQIRTSDGWRYQITPEDVLWAGRMLQGEGGGPEDPAAVLWTMTQLFAPAAQEEKYGNPRRFPTFTGLIQAYSQPINPRWRRDGQFCAPGGQYFGQEPCSDTRLARRARIASMPWEDIEPELREVVKRWSEGKLANPVPRAVEFAAPGVAAGFVRRNPGTMYVARLGNHFLATPGSQQWSANYVRMGAGFGLLAFGLGLLVGGITWYVWGNRTPQRSLRGLSASSKELKDARALARLLKKAGTSRSVAGPRIQKRYQLTNAELRSVLTAVWGSQL